MPRELPILMNGDMVRAVLSGTKTQTRRPVLVPKLFDKIYTVTHADYHSVFGCDVWIASSGIIPPYAQTALVPPYSVGDTLWVRETTWECYDNNDRLHYVADGPAPETASRHYKQRPSIHMPRHAARIFLPVTSVRVERVQDISGADAKAEGVKWETYPDLPVERHVHRACLQSFARLWDGLYAKRGLGWDANPFVWVIEWDAYRKPAPVVTDLALGEVE